MKKLIETALPAILIAVIFLAVIPFIHQQSLSVLLIIIILTIISFYFFHTKKDIIIYSIGLVLISLGEIWLVYNKVWTYPQPDFLGIPYFVPFMWGFLILNVNRFITGLFKK